MAASSSPRLRRSLLAVLTATVLLPVGVAPVAAADPSPSSSFEPAPTTEATPPPEATPTPAPIASPTPSPTSTPSPTATPTPSPTSTSTPAPTAAPSPTPTPSPTSPQPFGMNLYHWRSYVRQYTGSWCVAASSQMMANMVRLRRSSSAWIDRWYASQRRIIRYAQANDTLRWSRGTDPKGWAAALRRYGGGSTYMHRSFTSFGTALRYAAMRMRATGKPVGILAWNGRHAWVLHGFSATADPATTSAFTVTSVRVSGPLAGTDPKNRWMSSAAFRVKWGRYWQRDGYRGWVGKYVLVAP